MTEVRWCRAFVWVEVHHVVCATEAARNAAVIRSLSHDQNERRAMACHWQLQVHTTKKASADRRSRNVDSP